MDKLMDILWSMLTQLWENPLLFRILIIVLPVIIIPLLMRFVISRLIIFRAKRKYLPKYLKDQRNGWEIDVDEQAIEQLNTIALKRLKGAFIFKPDIKNDVKDIFMCIQNMYYPDAKNDDLKFSFSIKRLIDCSILFFCDFYEEYADKKWFKLIQNTRVVWFQRVWNVKKYFDFILSNPVVDKIRRSRLAGKIIRILLIPVFGIPSLIWYVLRSVVVSVLYEGFYRFLYALVLMKLSYYALYLFGRQNREIKSRIKAIPNKKLSEVNAEIQKMILPDSWKEKSSRYNDAVAMYLKSLEKMGLQPDRTLFETNPGIIAETIKIVGRFKKVFSRAASKSNPFSQNKTYNIDIVGLLMSLSNVYVPKEEAPYNFLRVRELIAGGYMASVLILHKVMYTPGVAPLLDNVSLDFAMKVKSFAENKLSKKDEEKKAAKEKYDMGKKAIKIIRSIANPGGIAVSFGNQVVLQQVQEILTEYLVLRMSRLTLYTWESHILKNKTDLGKLLL